MKKNPLLALLLALAFIASAPVAQAQTSPQPAPAVKPAGSHTTMPRASAPGARASRTATPDRSVVIPKLDLRAPSGPGVICACVRSGDRA